MGAEVTIAGEELRGGAAHQPRGAGKHIGGEVVALSDTLGGIDALLDAVGTPPQEAAVLEANVDYDQTCMV